MIIKLKKKLGTTEYEFIMEGIKPFDVLQEAAQMSQMPDLCPLCNSDDTLELQMNKSKSEKGEFTFIYVYCKHCNAKAQIGQYKTGGIFWKPFEKYEGKVNAKKSSDYDVPVVDQD